MKKLVSLLFITFAISLQSQIGVTDPSFNIGTGSNDYVFHLALQPDQKILACGTFTSFNGLSRKFLVRLNPDGSVDTNFNPQINATGAIAKTLLQNDGKIIAIGYETNFSAGFMVRLNSDGSIDNSFTSPSGSTFGDIIQTSDGKLLVGGIFYPQTNPNVKTIARLNTDGSIDTTFNAGNVGGDYIASSIIILSNNKILIGGYFSKYNNVNRTELPV